MSTPRGSSGAAPFSTPSASRRSTRYADPSGDAFETLRMDGKALGLPISLLIDRDGCELASSPARSTWDSADARPLIGALKGG